jgi:DNA-binding winged helix-turn-helix (wHTH) protein/tetratricopeptide (TPR) repeat protein
MLKEMSNLQFGEFTLNLRLRELRRQEKVLPVSGKAFDLLVYMASNPGRPLTKTELLDAVWPELAVEESNLSQNVFLLRKVLGSGLDGPGRNGYIKTLAGRGYQFAAEVVEVPAAMPDSVAVDAPEVSPGTFQDLTIEATQTRVVVHHDVEHGVSWNVSRRAKVVGAVSAALVAGVAGWFGWQYWQDRPGGEPVKVVLTNLEGTTGDAVLDRSLTDALRIDLVQSPFVTVVPGSTVRATLAQMTHKPDEVMSAATAREVCERTNSQAVLSGSVARVGRHFLLTAAATSCADGSVPAGSVLAETKREADTAEDLPHSIDMLAASLRQKLGESRRSVARLSVPLFPMRTVSLDALKAYSQATQLSSQGKSSEAMAMLKQAVAADPKFASGYYDLAALYYSNGDSVNGRAILEKAYALREDATEPVRFAITALYSTYSTQDFYEAERNDRAWVERYPNSAQAWNQLSNVERDLANWPDAVESSKRVLALVPGIQGLYANLAYNQIHRNDFKGARATCDQAIARHLDGDRIRSLYIDLSLLLQDHELLKTQLDWAAAHPEANFTHEALAEMAIGEGRFKDASRETEQISASFRRQGLGDLADAVMKGQGVNLMEAGDVEDGARLFRSAPMDPESGAELVGLAEIGEIKEALADLHSLRQKYPQGTLWNHYYGPRIEAVAALTNHKPQEALALMDKARELDSRDLDHAKFRGDAYLASGEAAQAEKEFRWATEHHDFNPLLGDYPLSWLGLGRALAAEGKRTEAVEAYQHFLALWAHADPDAIYLKQGKQELAELEKTGLPERVLTVH